MEGRTWAEAWANVEVWEEAGTCRKAIRRLKCMSLARILVSQPGQTPVCHCLWSSKLSWKPLGHF